MQLHLTPHRHPSLEKMNLGQQDQAIRLSNTLGKLPNGKPDDADHRSPFTHACYLLHAHTNYSFEDLV
jgi:hypothetical protein